MKRVVIFFLLIPLCFFSFSPKVKAATDDALREFSGADSLWKSVPDQEEQEAITRFMYMRMKLCHMFKS